MGRDVADLWWWSERAGTDGDLGTDAQTIRSRLAQASDDGSVDRDSGDPISEEDAEGTPVLCLDEEWISATWNSWHLIRREPGSERGIGRRGAAGTLEKRLRWAPRHDKKVGIRIVPGACL